MHRFQAGKEEAGDLRPHDVIEKLARQDYNVVATQSGLPEHRQKVINRSTSMARAEAIKILDEDHDANPQVQEPDTTEEVLLSQPLVETDRFAREWDQAWIANAPTDEEAEPSSEEIAIDEKLTSRLLVQVITTFELIPSLIYTTLKT